MALRRCLILVSQYAVSTPNLFISWCRGTMVFKDLYHLEKHLSGAINTESGKSSNAYSRCVLRSSLSLLDGNPREPRLGIDAQLLQKHNLHFPGPGNQRTPKRSLAHLMYAAVTNPRSCLLHQTLCTSLVLHHGLALLLVGDASICDA